MTDETNLIPERDNEPIDPTNAPFDDVSQADDAVHDEAALNEAVHDDAAYDEVYDEGVHDDEGFSVPDVSPSYDPLPRDSSLWSAYSPDTDVDIDAALAAVASLSEPVTQQEAEEIAIDAAPPPVAPSAYAPALSMPPLSRLRRGHPGSLIPALLLIGVGAWLTLTTTSGATIDPLLLAAIVIGGAAIALIAQWIGSGRWSRGTLFFGVLIALVFGLVFAATRGLNLVQAYPLVLTAAGIAFIAAGLLSRPPLRRAFTPGLLLIVGGMAGMVFSSGIVPPDVLALGVTAAPIVALLILVLLLLPRLRRR